MKKRNKFIFLATLSTACLLSLASCQGAQGPKGDQGTPGINGTNGTDGKDGQDGQNGKSVLSGKGVPASSLGTDGDSYIDTETFDFYVKQKGTWSKEGNIKGTTGDKGDTGDSGSKGEDGTSIRTGKGVPSESLGNDGDSYIDLSTFDFYVKADGKWSNEGNIKGDKGDKGDKGNNGSNGSDGLDGKPGEDGATAWSNTILPAEGGYVTVDKGSEVVGEDKYFTFTFHPTDPDSTKNKVTELTLNGQIKGSDSDKTYAELVNTDSKMQLKVPVVEGGYVVYAKFGTESDIKKYDIIGDDNKAYDTLQDAVKSSTCNKVTLKNTVSLDDHLTIPENKSFEIDLNGNNISFSGKTIYVNGNLKVTNSGGSVVEIVGSIVVGATGTYVVDKLNKNFFGGFSTLSRNGLQTFAATGTSDISLNIGERVKFSSPEGKSAITLTSDKVTVTVEKGGEVANNYAQGKAIEVKKGSVNVEGTVSASNGSAIEVTGGSLTVKKDAEISVTDSANAVTISSGEVTVEKGGEVKSTSGTAIKAEGGEVVVSGTVSSTSSTAISVKQSSTAENETKVTLAGTVSGTKAVTVTSGTLNVVEGGSVTGSTNGIEVKGGNVTVSGGTVESTSTQNTNAAISVVQGDGSLVETKVTISGGKVESDAGSAVSVTKESGDDKTQSVTVNLSGGSYVTNGKQDAIKIEESTSATVDKTGVKYGIKTVVEDDEGGSISVKDNLTSAAKDADVVFTFNPTGNYEIKTVYVNGEEQTDFTGKTLTVKMSEKGITVKVVYDKYLNSVEGTKDGSSEKYSSINEALDKGCTSVKLLKDSISDTITLTAKSLKIDLNGHKLDFKEDNRIFVKNGSILEIEGTGEINVTTKTDSQSFIKVLNENNSNVNKVTVGENVTINDECSTPGKTVYALAVFDSKKESSNVFTKSNIEFNGTINVDGTGLSVVGTVKKAKNYESSYNTMTLGTKAKITSTFIGDTKKYGKESVESLAIYQAGLSEVTINGGEYSAIDSAIEVRNGNLTVNGGTFKSTATEFSATKNDNGKTIIGAALAVSQHTTRENINVTVKGGTFTGLKGLYAANVQGNDATYIEKVSINLQKGTFTGSDADIDVRDKIKCEIGKDVVRTDDKTYNNTIAEVTDATKLKEALASDTIKYVYVKGSISVTEQLTVKGSYKEIIGIDDAVVTCSSPILVEATNVSFKDVKLVNNNTDGGNTNGVVTVKTTVKSIKFENVELIKETGGNNPGILVENSKDKLDMDLINCNIKTSITGYPIRLFRPVDLNMDGGSTEGWCSVYFKAGSEGSTFNATKVYINAINYLDESTTQNSNGFAVFQTETGNININLKNCSIDAAKQEGKCYNSLLTVGHIPFEVNNVVEIDATNGKTTLTIEGSESTFNGEELFEYYKSSNNKYPNVDENGNKLNTGEIIIKAGKYKKDPSAYVDKTKYEVKTLTYDPDGYKYEVVARP